MKNYYKDYRKPLEQQSEKWWLHQYCLYKGISLSKVKVKDRLVLDKNFTKELGYLQSLIKPSKKHKQRIQNIETILKEHREEIINSLPCDWDDYDWDNHIVYENSKNSKLLKKHYQHNNESMELIFNEYDLYQMKEFNIDGELIRVYQIEKFREDMIACATSFGLTQGIIHSQEDNGGRVVKLLRTICKDYMNYLSDIRDCVKVVDECDAQVQISKISSNINKWVDYCRRLDIAINKYTTDSSKWKNNKKLILDELKEKASNDEGAKVFLIFYTKYGSIEKKTQAKIDKLIELNLPNINEDIAGQIVKYSTLANVLQLKNQ